MQVKIFQRGSAILKKLLFFLLIFIITIFIGCNSKENILSLEFTFENDQYIGFKNISENYTMDDAKQDNCVVLTFNEFIENEKVWESFVKSSSKNINVAVRLAIYYSDDNQQKPYFKDIFYRDGNYYIFTLDDQHLSKVPFKYLLTLTGEDGIPSRESEFTVLTNNNSLTHKELLASFYSSGGLSNQDYNIVFMTTEDIIR